MVKLTYRLLDGTDRIVEVEKRTLQQALFEVRIVQYGITGQVIKIEEGEGSEKKIYTFPDIIKMWRNE